MGNSTAIFWPVMAQVLLIYAIYMLVSVRRVGAVKAGKAKASDFKTPFVEPEASAVAVRNLSNQFELPVLIFAASIALYVTGGGGTAAVVVAWIFVLARLAHAYVHVTSNRVLFRRRLFIASLAVNFAQWLMLAVHIA